MTNLAEVWLREVATCEQSTNVCVVDAHAGGTCNHHPDTSEYWANAHIDTIDESTPLGAYPT